MTSEPSENNEKKLTTIGIIHSPFTEPGNMPIQPAGAENVRGRVEVFEAFQSGIQDLDGFSHVILLYWFHQSRGYKLKVMPFMDSVLRGLFATRAPRRPNPIGLSVVRLDRIENGVLHIRDVDILDSTPLLDIKPYVPQFDARGEIRTGWLEKRGKNVVRQRSDDRFQ